MEDRTNELNISRQGGVLEIQLNRPKVNAIDFDLSRRINEAVVMLRDDPELRVGLVTATGEKIFPRGGTSRRSIAVNSNSTTGGKRMSTCRVVLRG